jgi:hypothetical protein
MAYFSRFSSDTPQNLNQSRMIPRRNLDQPKLTSCFSSYFLKHQKQQVFAVNGRPGIEKRHWIHMFARALSGFEVRDAGCRAVS